MKLQLCLLLCLSSILLSCAREQEKFLTPSSNYCAEKKLDGEYIIHWKNLNTELVRKSKSEIDDLVRKNYDAIDFVEPNYRVHADATPEAMIAADLVPRNLDVHKIIHSDFAWQSGYTGIGIRVAVVDSGVNIYHPILRGHLDINVAEKNGLANVDDDNNGYIDDIYGWNFVNSQSMSKDETGHGTAMAGIITGSPYNSESLSIAPGVKILPIDFMNEGGGTEFNAKQALTYAVNRKVQIINNSWSINCSELLRDAFMSWSNENIIFVNAAGNQPIDVDIKNIFPAGLELPNHITVGSSDYDGNLSAFSGYGRSVSILAPGESISTLSLSGNSNVKSKVNGTSISAAIVSASAAILWQAFPKLSAKDIIFLLNQGATVSPSGERIINIKGSLLVGYSLVHTGAILVH